MDFFDHSKSIVENLYLLSGPVIALFGFVAISQLRLTKKTLIITSKREAAKLAADQIKVYNDIIIPLQNALFYHAETKNIKKIKIEIGDFHLDSIIEKIGLEETQKLVLERVSLMPKVLDIINAMESFSTYFVKGIADEEIAYSTFGHAFCEHVDDLYFYIATCITKESEGKVLQDLISLYKMWDARRQKEKLYKEKQAISDKLDSIKTTKVSPIGVK